MPPGDQQFSWATCQEFRDATSPSPVEGFFQLWADPVHDVQFADSTYSVQGGGLPIVQLPSS